MISRGWTGKITKRVGMNRSSARVVLLNRESFAKSGSWGDHLELRRDAHANFSVWWSKFAEDPTTRRRRWFDWEKIKNIKSPIEIRNVIQEGALRRNVEFDWGDAIPLVASIDWVTATVIASKLKCELPALPSADALLAQRSLCTLSRVEIGAEWGYDMHEISVSFERWIRILSGESWKVDKPYYYEGERFPGSWYFDGVGNLEVSSDDGFIGWTGDLRGLNFIDGPKLDTVDLAQLALSAAQRPE